jgi:hypothetical protein
MRSPAIAKACIASGGGAQEALPLPAEPAEVEQSSASRPSARSRSRWTRPRAAAILHGNYGRPGRSCMWTRDGVGLGCVASGGGVDW